MAGLAVQALSYEEVGVLLRVVEERLCEPVEFGRELAPRTEEVLESVVTKLRHAEKLAYSH